jgi:hypothetical protein
MSINLKNLQMFVRISYISVIIEKTSQQRVISSKSFEIDLIG